MKKLLLTAYCCLAAWACAWAFDGYDRMYLHFKDGTIQEFYLGDDMKFKTINDKFIIICDGNRYEYPREDVAVIKYGMATDALPAAVEDNMTQVKVGDGELLLSAVTERQMLCIYSVDGKMLLSREVDRETSAVDISDLASGVYLVSINGKTEKIHVR